MIENQLITSPMKDDIQGLEQAKPRTVTELFADCLRAKTIANEIFLTLKPEDIRHLALTNKKIKASLDMNLSLKTIFTDKFTDIMSMHTSEQGTQMGTPINQGVNQETQT